jgi:hypothetical protein
MAAHEELEEHVHHAHEPFDKMVAATMAIIAAFLAVVSVLGQHFITEQLLMQAKASDQWSYYQAKDIRRFTAETTRDTLAELRPGTGTQDKYNQQATRYRNDAGGIQEKAQEYEKESERSGRKGHRFHFGEIFLEIAIVFSSLAILTKARLVFFVAVGLAAAGTIIAATALLL